MNWRNILKSGKDILSALNNLVDDKHFRDSLGKAGSLLSFVTAAYDVSQQIKEELLSEEERAHNSLSKFVLKTTKEYFKSLRKKREAVATTNESEQVVIEEDNNIDKSNNYNKLKQELDHSLKQ